MSQRSMTIVSALLSVSLLTTGVKRRQSNMNLLKKLINCVKAIGKKAQRFLNKKKAEIVRKS